MKLFKSLVRQFAFVLLSIFIVFGGATPALAATAGPNFAGAGVASGGSGSNWSHEERISANDNSYTDTDVNKNSSSKTLSATDFGFSIPSDATIDGIQVTIGRKAEDSSSIQDRSVRLIKNGSQTGDNNGATSTNWPTSENVASYGSTSNLWGTTWTPSQINSSNFGVALSVDNNNFSHSRTAYVDYIKVTITYTEVTEAVTPPDTTITDKPTDPSNSSSASFGFTSDVEGATFECQIDNGGDLYYGCTSFENFSDLSDGSHTFRVRAKDGDNVDPTPAEWTWVVDTEAPIVDVCENIDELQTEIPEGYESLSEGQCTLIPVECVDTPVEDVIVSDTSTNVNGDNPSVATWIHSLWASISGATWIWDVAQVVDPTIDQTDVFTRTFEITGPLTSANLEIAADNGYKAEVNDNVVVDNLDVENNFATTANYDVVSYLTTGSNTLTFIVKNFALADSTYDTNPAGLIYKLTLGSNQCITPPTPTCSDGIQNQDETGIDTGGVCSEPPATDVCPNIEGDQSTVPDEMEIVDGQCVGIVTPPTPTDVCPNIEGDQATVPDGMEIVDGQCVDIVTPPTDVCPNEETDPGVQTEGPCQNEDVCLYDEGIQTNASECTPPVISSQAVIDVNTTSVTITWTTDHPATSRVVYDTVSHPTVDVAPNYGYANSTIEDSYLVINHSVTISGLDSGTTYYFRSISRGSPEAFGDEFTGTTSTPAPRSGSSRHNTSGGGGSGTTIVTTPTPFVFAFAPETTQTGTTPEIPTPLISFLTSGQEVQLEAPILAVEEGAEEVAIPEGQGNSQVAAAFLGMSSSTWIWLLILLAIIIGGWYVYNKYFKDKNKY